MNSTSFGKREGIHDTFNTCGTSLKLLSMALGVGRGETAIDFVKIALASVLKTSSPLSMEAKLN